MKYIDNQHTVNAFSSVQHILLSPMQSCRSSIFTWVLCNNPPSLENLTNTVNSLPELSQCGIFRESEF